MKEYEPLKQKSVVPDTILIADDDEINRAILNEIFKDTTGSKRLKTERNVLKSFWRRRSVYARCCSTW